MKDEFWEQPEIVEQFAAREPDHRLASLTSDYPDPATVRVLDLGCAAGRNTIFLAENGFYVEAVDSSDGMVRRTRARLARLIGDEEARERVRNGRMDDLTAYADRSFALVVALGIYHNARSEEEWERAVAETARVVEPGGRVLVNHFTPEVDLTGDGLRKVPDRSNLFDGFPGGPVVLLTSDSLDRAMGRHGLSPVVPSRTVAVELNPGRRVSVNALYARWV